MRVWAVTSMIVTAVITWTAALEVAALIGPGPHQVVKLDPLVLLDQLRYQGVSWRGMWASSAIYPGDATVRFALVVVVALLLVGVALVPLVLRSGPRGVVQVIEGFVPDADTRRRLVYIIGAAVIVLAGVVVFGQGGIGTVLLIALPVAVAGGIVAVVGGKGPFGLPARVPRRVAVPARVVHRDRPFLAWSRGLLGQAKWVLGSDEDSVGVLGPPRVGKTAGVIVPQIVLWSGSVVSTSTKPDVLRATAQERWEQAAKYGGKVYVYAPTASGLVEGLRPMRWSPLAGCDVAEVAVQRVETLIENSAVGKGVEDPTHWQEGARRLLRSLFFAAANAKSPRRGDFALVREWLAQREFEGPRDILRGLNSYAGDFLAEQLWGVSRTNERELGSFFSAAETAVRVTNNPTVLRSCSGTDLDAQRFLLTRSSLWIVSPTTDQKQVAPLISMLIHWLVSTAYQLHHEGRLAARLLLSLDELANIAPLADLGSTLSQGPGQGVTTSWAAQSQAQLRDRYGEHGAEAIWSATSDKLIFGGLADGPFLDRVSTLIGDRPVKVKGRSEEAGSVWAGGKRSDRRPQVTTTTIWRPWLTAAQLRLIPRGWVLLLHQAASPYMLRVPIAARCRQLRRALRPWAAPAAAPAAAPQVRVEETSGPGS